MEDEHSPAGAEEPTLLHDRSIRDATTSAAATRTSAWSASCFTATICALTAGACDSCWRACARRSARGCVRVPSLSERARASRRRVPVARGRGRGRARPLLGNARLALRAGAADRTRKSFRVRRIARASTWCASDATSRAKAVRDRVHEDIVDGRHNGVTGTPTILHRRHPLRRSLGFLLDARSAAASGRGAGATLGARVRQPARVGGVRAAAGRGRGVALREHAAGSVLPTGHGFVVRHRARRRRGVDDDRRMVFRRACSRFSFCWSGSRSVAKSLRGALVDPKAAILPVVAAIGGVLAPAAIYLALNSGPTAPGWSVPTATDVAFTLGILALLGDRVPTSLRVFVAALAVVDDILSNADARDLLSARVRGRRG